MTEKLKELEEKLKDLTAILKDVSEVVLELTETGKLNVKLFEMLNDRIK